MIIGSTLLLALVAAGVATLVKWGLDRVGANGYVSFWLALALALFIMATGPIKIG